MAAAAWVALWLSSASGLHHLHHLSTAPVATAPVQFYFVATWTVMTVAMMLPTSLPVIATLHAFASERSDRLLLVALTVLGYLMVWISFGALVLPGYLSWQWLLASSPWLAGRVPGGRPTPAATCGRFSVQLSQVQVPGKMPLSVQLRHRALAGTPRELAGFSPRNRSRCLLRGLLLGADVVDVCGKGRESGLDADSGAANGGREERPLGSPLERAGGCRLAGVGRHLAGFPLTGSGPLRDI